MGQPATTYIVKNVELQHELNINFAEQGGPSPIPLLEDNTSSHLYKIKCPTLLIWGDKDKISTRSDQEAIVNAIVNSQLIIYPGAGHSLYCEEPVRTASDISAFIAKLLS